MPTWLLCYLCPSNHRQRLFRGGGLATVHKNRFSIRTVNLRSPTSFEVLLFNVSCPNPFHCAIVYRPPGTNGTFLSEFSDFLTSIVHLERILLVGDFNIHINDSTNNFASNFLNLTDAFNLFQHVSGPTHSKSNTLDLVFTLGLKVSSITTEQFPVTDHFCVLFNLTFESDFTPAKRVKTSRILNSLSAAKFSAAFDNSVISLQDNIDNIDSIDSMVLCFSSLPSNSRCHCPPHHSYPPICSPCPLDD